MHNRPNLWKRNELILTFNLYCKMPFGKMHSGNKDIIKLATLIGRSPGAVARKLGNFARFDPELKKRNVGGLAHGSKADEFIWNEFYKNWNSLAFESEKLLAKYKGEKLVNAIEDDPSLDYLNKKGLTREAITKIRVNQSFFRKAILASYNYKCCITGLSETQLLIASHIKPWSVDEENRVNPQNGLCLNAFHDRAFDAKLMTVTPDYKIRIGKQLKENENKKLIKEFFLKYDSKSIILPNKFLPDKAFLEWHSSKVK